MSMNLSKVQEKSRFSQKIQFVEKRVFLIFDKKRIQAYEGVVISKKNQGINLTVTVRATLQGIGVERCFLLHSPKIKSLEVKRSSRIRRAKLYYLRNLSGKAARLKERFKKN